MFHYDFVPRGVCSRAIHIDLDDAGEVVEGVTFDGGCNGNLKAIGLLIEGRPVDEVVEVLAGNTCGPRKTSCADQLTLGLREAQEALRAGAGA